jgi:hypothetical protein
MNQQTTLRGLAKAYASGILEKEKYRKDRTAFIEAVLSGGISLPLNGQRRDAPKATTPNDTFDIKTSEMQGQAVDLDITGTAPPQRNPRLIIGGIAGLLILIIIAAILLSGGDDDAPVQPQQQAVAAIPAIDNSPTAAQDLIHAFLDRNTWSEASMDAFIAEWEVMPEPEKTSIRNTVELGQLANAIYKKLLEERALSGIGNPETSYEKQRQLVEFAATLGIDDARISLPEPPPESPQTL